MSGLGQDPGGLIHTRFLGEGGLDHGRGLLSALPLFPYMGIQVTALARHPSAI